MAGVAAHPGRVEPGIAPHDPKHEYAEGGHAETGHAHAHGPLHHHFDDMEQQKEATTLGMWSFLSTEVMMFGGLFFVYTLYRQLSAVKAHELGMADPFAVGGHLLNVPLGTANTFVLLASSFTMAMAVHAAQMQKRKPMLIFMLLTLLFGSTFLGIKAVEWTTDYNEGLVPALNWDPNHTLEEHKGPEGQTYIGVTGSGVNGNASIMPPGDAETPDDKVGSQPAPALKGAALSQSEAQESSNPMGAPNSHTRVNTSHLQMYFVIYFCMTGLHAIHMVIGAGVLIVMMIMGARGAFEGGNDQPIELFGLYWHFVDIVWVFLFPLLYLVGGFRL